MRPLYVSESGPAWLWRLLAGLLLAGVAFVCGVGVGAASVGVYVGAKDRAFWLESPEPAVGDRGESL